MATFKCNLRFLSAFLDMAFKGSNFILNKMELAVFIIQTI